MGLPAAYGDAMATDIIVGQLLENAFKYSPEGGAVTVRAALAGDRIEVTVEDEGIGIAPADRERVFERFVQGEAGDRRRFGGIGLGVFDLLVDRIGIDHQPARADHVMLAQPCGTAEIDQRVGFLEQPRDALARQPMIGIVDRVPIGPARAQTEALHQRLEIGDIGAVIGDDAIKPRIVGVGAVILDVPRLVAELFEPDQVVERLPGDTRQGHLTRKMQHHDPPARGHADTPLLPCRN